MERHSGDKLGKVFSYLNQTQTGIFSKLFNYLILDQFVLNPNRQFRRMPNLIETHKKFRFICGRKSVDRIATQSMSKICNLWGLIVVDCDYAESYGRFLSGGNADGSHAVYIVPDDS